MDLDTQSLVFVCQSYTFGYGKPPSQMLVRKLLVEKNEKRKQQNEKHKENIGDE